jgi:importin subunit beta-1
VFGCLGSSARGARDVAAQVVSAAATIELPQGQWLDVIQALVTNVTSASTPQLKQSSLKVLGYICEEIDPDVLESQSNLILTAVIQGMRKEETDPDTRLAGTQALYNALAFVKKNFDNETERNYIMQTVCETTQAERSDIRLAAYECVVSIAETYYDLLAPYMQALYSLTLQCVERSTKDEEEDEVGQQAVEFWSTICDEELDLMASRPRRKRLRPALLPRLPPRLPWPSFGPALGMALPRGRVHAFGRLTPFPLPPMQEEEEEAKEEERQPERRSQNYARGAVPALVPLLLEALCKQEEDAEDSWNLAMAAATCLSRAARVSQDLVVQPVMTFIGTHIGSADWHRREAATLAFGSILEGPAPSLLQPLVAQAMPVMIGLLKDAQVQVKDTAAWTIARICEHHITFIAPEMWGLMLRTPQPGEPPEVEGALFLGLKDHPRVASNVCLALHNLAEQCEATRDNPTNDLSGPFVDLARALLACTERPDATESNLRSSAYEALNTVLTNSADDTAGSVLQLLPVILQRLEATFAMQLLSAEDREAQSELQGLLCGCLQVITCKLGAQIKPHADQMMQAFLQVFGAKNSTVHEEALMAVGAIANATEAEFDKYMPHFRPFLSLGLSNYEEHQVCQVAVGVVGDICRSLEGRLLPYCDEILGLLLKNLQSPKLNRNVKPPILSCFGDIALAIGGNFEKYMDVTMSMLQQASATEVDMEDDDLVDYLHQLQEGIFEAYTGVLQGLRADSKADVFLNYVQGCLNLLVLVSKVTEQHGTTDDLLRAAVGVAGDLASTIGPRFKQMVRQSPYKESVKLLMKEATKSRTDGTKQVAQWANTQCFGH